MNHSYNYPISDGDVASALFVGTFIFFFFLFALVSYIVTVFLLGRILKKAGLPQWAAWVPVYNTWKFLELGGQLGWWAVLYFVPFLGLISIIFMAIAAHHIGLKFGKEKWFVLVAIFLPLVWLIWLAFDDSKWPESKKLKTKITKKK